MYRVFVNNETVFEGKMKRIGGGGTKTAYQLGETDKVVLLPNLVDGARLANIFDRVCDDEVFMYNYLLSRQILGLKVEHCFVQQTGIIEEENKYISHPIGDGNSICGLYAPSFLSFEKDLAHIFDKKDIFTFNWTAPEVETISEWIEIFNPLIEDLKLLINSGIVPYGDSYNFLIAEKGSPYYKGSGEYAVRYFGFDFASKRGGLSPFRNLSDQKIELMSFAIVEAVDYICFCVGKLPNDKISEVKNAILEKNL